MRTRRRLEVSALMWGVFFACIAGFGGWIGLGRPVDWTLMKLAAPSALIIIGIVGLVVSRGTT